MHKEHLRNKMEGIFAEDNLRIVIEKSDGRETNFRQKVVPRLERILKGQRERMDGVWYYPDNKTV